MSQENAPDETATAATAKNNRVAWLTWAAINLGIAGFFGYALVAPAASVKTAFLPGTTTSGHYQIELDCDACHQPSRNGAEHSADNVMQDACNRCHADDLENVFDTHPASKFNDPVKAVLLETLDAQNCLTCHQEHVPHRTLASGLTVPKDYCWHCHEDVAESRPSHQGMAFDSCATAGCHNYHDNRALFEKHLNEHFGEPDVKAMPIVVQRNFAERYRQKNTNANALALGDADSPESVQADQELLRDWAETAHAAAGVNCSHCHNEKVGNADDPKDGDAAWSDEIAIENCQKCHDQEVETFLKGKHGMRLASGLSPMSPEQARLPMHAGVAHKQLTCNACHSGHRFDTQYAAVTACQTCHADDHSIAYAESSHAALWDDEVSGKAAHGTGVSCATCHMPRLVDGKRVWVNHNQNAVLRPNESMARDVCAGCHSLEYSLSSLADPESIQSCFAVGPKETTRSVEMAHQWFEERAARRKKP